MAYQLTYTDATGTTHPTSHWRVTYVAVDLVGRTARAVLCGYHDADAYDARRQPVGTRDVVVSGDDFTAMMTDYVAPGGNTDLFAMAYQVASLQYPDFATATVV